MTRLRLIGLVCTCLLAAVQPAAAQQVPGPKMYSLTLDQALARARVSAPAVLAARARIGQARGRLVGASVLLRHNPSLELGGGPRFTSGGVSPDIDASLGLKFELGGQRAARMDAAAAAVEQAEAVAADTRRLLLRETAVTFLRARHADERLAIAGQARQLTAELHRVARRRNQTGDAGVLDVNLAALALARAEAEVETVRAARDRALGDLQALLGLEPEARLSVQGGLLPRRPDAAPPSPANLAHRPDLRGLDTAIREAEAEVRLGKAQAWPDLGVRLGYGREEEANLVVGSLHLTLPLFDRGQGIQATATARATALRLERRQAEAAARARVRTMNGRYQRLLRAVERLQRDGLAGLARTDRLALRSYETGEMPLAGLLAIRRELIEAKTTYTDLLLDTALAGVELRSEAGVL